MAQDKSSEILDRVRRIEIRLTRLMEAQNIETGVNRPVWRDGGIELPSHVSSLSDCLKVIPSDWPKEREVDLIFHGQVLCKLKVV